MSTVDSTNQMLLLMKAASQPTADLSDMQISASKLNKANDLDEKKLTLSSAPTMMDILSMCLKPDIKSKPTPT